MRILLPALAALTLLPLTLQAENAPGGRHGHHDFPQSVHAFHDVMAPIWHAPAGGERSGAICRDADAMQALARAIVEAPPPDSVDSVGWHRSAAALVAQTVVIGDKCTADQTGDLDQAFSDLHHAFHGLVRHVGHRH